MGCPSAAIVIEELVQLGVKRLLRIGTCGGLQPDLQLGDLIVAVSAVAADSTAQHLVREPHAPPTGSSSTAPCTRRRRWASACASAPSSRATSSTTPTTVSTSAWSDRGILAVEMEAAVLFTLGALRKVKAGCLLTVSDVVEGEFVRISDEQMRAAVDQMTELALGTVTAESVEAAFVVNPAAGNWSAGKRWPELVQRAAELGLSGEALLSDAPGRVTDLTRRAVEDGAELVVVVGGDGTVNEAVNGLLGTGASASWLSCRAELGTTSRARSGFRRTRSKRSPSPRTGARDRWTPDAPASAPASATSPISPARGSAAR